MSFNFASRIFSPLGIAQTSLALLSLIAKKFKFHLIFSPLGIAQTSLTLLSLVEKILNF